MPVVLVVNPKGGVGKSTVATNLAGWFASRGHPTMLGDLDKQQSRSAGSNGGPPRCRRSPRGTWMPSASHGRRAASRT